MILVNGRFLSQRMTGVHRYAYEICCALHERGVNLLVLAPDTIQQQYNCPFRIKQIGGKGSHWWEQVTLARYVRKHYNGHRLLTLTGLSPIAYKHNVLTIHDVSFLVEPKWFSRSYYLFYKFLTPLAAKQAEQIITVSNFSRSELMKYLQLPAEKIRVVYNGVRNELMATNKEEIPKQPYLLSVCSMDPRKNLKKLLDAYLQSGITIPIYLVGGTYSVFAHEEMQHYRNKNNIIFLGYVPDERLASLYKNALAFVNASLYEGFGTPNIEAMQQGCPLVISSIPVYHEICQGAALFFNPNNVYSIRNALVRIVNDEALRLKLVEAGNEVWPRYNWSESAKQIKCIYEGEVQNSICR